MAEPAKKERNALKKVDAERMAQGVYSAIFSDGTEFSADLRTICPTYEQLPEMAQRTLCYGLKQKLDDSMAGVETVEEAVEEVQSTWQAIVEGHWTIRIPGEGVEGGLFARAYAQRHDVSLADAKAKIAAMVEKNLNANRDRLTAAGKKKEADELSERSIFNVVRNVALERDTNLKAIYDDLREKKAKKASKKADVQIDLSE